MIILQLAPATDFVREETTRRGVEVVVEGLSRELKSRHEVHVVAPIGTRLDGVFVHETVPALKSVGRQGKVKDTLDDDLRTMVNAGLLGLSSRYHFDPADNEELIKYIRLDHVRRTLEICADVMPDIMHCHDDLMLPFMYRQRDDLGIPFIHTLHFTYEEFRKVLGHHMPFSIGDARELVAVSKSQRDMYNQQGLSVSNVVHNGINPEMYAFSPNPQGVYMVYISCIMPEKGQDKLVEIFPSLKDMGMDLVLVGTKDDPQFFEREIAPHCRTLPTSGNFLENYLAMRGNHPSIFFAEGIDNGQKVRVLQNAAVFVIPPYSRREPFGLVAIESMSCGTPAVAPRTDNSYVYSEIIENSRNGVLVSDLGGYRAAIDSARNLDRAECALSVREGEKFTSRGSALKYESLYRLAIERNRKNAYA